MTSLKSVVVLVLLLCGACGGIDAFRWPDVADCGRDIPDVISRVSTILIAGDGINVTEEEHDELVAIAKQASAEAVICAVRTLVDGWLAPGATQHPKQVQAAVRGRNWLDSIGGE